MGQGSEIKMLKIYFENGQRSFTVREMSKLANIPRSTVQVKFNSLRHEKLIDKENAIIDGLFFRTRKINYYIEKLVQSGFVDFVVEELNPSCIILFGSFRKGDSIKASDIDIFVESFIRKDLNLNKFERKLGHKIDMFIESNIKDLQNNLFNNVINGIKLYGSIKLK